MPTDSQREAYLRRKLVHLADVEILDWVHRTAGLSFASLAELIISVCCLANDFDQTIEILRNQHGSGSFRVDGFEKARKSSETIGTTIA